MSEEFTDDSEDLTTVVDDDGHTLEDITPWDVEEPDDDTQAAVLNAPYSPAEHDNWDRQAHGGMWQYADDEDLELECQAGDSCEKGV